MDDLYKRMAYRNAVSAGFEENNKAAEQQEQNQPTKAPNNGSTATSAGQGAQTQAFKVYHAHGHLVRCDIMGVEDKDTYSAFSEVFFSFDKAKEYLLQRFNNLIAVVYQNDPTFTDDALSGNGFHKCSKQWQQEYISEYIDYQLVITELSSDYDENTPINFSSTQKTEWYFRYNGEARTRYYVFGDREYEFRANDFLPSAGTKFKRGDLVRCVDWEYSDKYEGAMVVLNVPQKPQDNVTAWENCYELLLIDDYYSIKRSGRVIKVKIHEADLEIFDQEQLQDKVGQIFHSPTLALQKVVLGAAGLDDKMTSSILNGDVLFNCATSWQSIAELNKKDN